MGKLNGKKLIWQKNLDNIMNRMSLLISEITASFGQAPLVLPPDIIGKPSDNN